MSADGSASGRLNPTTRSKYGAYDHVVRNTVCSKYVFASTPQPSYELKNHKSAKVHFSAVEAELAEYEALGKIEWQDVVIPGSDPQSPVSEFVTITNPWGAVQKSEGDKVRPVVDALMSGANASLASWPMRKPTIEAALQHIPQGFCLGKLDWSSGFHHLALHPSSRRITGFRHPRTGRIGRFTVNPLGVR